MQHPLPSQEELTAFYEREYEQGLYATFSTATEMKNMTARRRLSEIGDQVPPGRWLDVGASNGAFVAEAIEAGISAEGIELSNPAVRAAQDAGLPVRCAALEDCEGDGSYDVVTAFDVIEHVRDPLEFLRIIGTQLGPDGNVVLTTPDLNCVFRRLMGSRWYFYIPEEHLFYFSRKTIRALLSKAGFVTIRLARSCKPLTYDYALTQFAEYNPLVYRVLNQISKILPTKLKSAILPLYIGEMMVIARRA